jgi:hypothetical protein
MHAQIHISSYIDREHESTGKSTLESEKYGSIASVYGDNKAHTSGKLLNNRGPGQKRNCT